MGAPDRQQYSLEEAEVILGAEAKQQIDSLVALNDQLDKIDEKNRELYERITAQYEGVLAAIAEKLKAPDTSGQLKGKCVAMKKEMEAKKAAFREKFPEFVAEEEQKKATEQLEKKASAVFEKLKQTAQIPEEEKKAFIRYWKELPVDQKSTYLGQLNGTLNNKDAAGVLTGFRGTLFELSRRAILQRQGKEELGDMKTPIYVEYMGYDKVDPQVDRPPTKRFVPNMKNPQGDIQNDIHGIIRNGKRYVYETKAYPRRQLGAEYGAGESATQRNQLLKYQKAIEDGSIAGVTVEIQGRVDNEFLRWATGEGLTERGAIPDVEIIYSMQLPSGREYRFVLKRGKGEGLRFENEKSDYTIDDKIVIRGLAQSVRDKSFRKIIMDGNIETDTGHPLVTREVIDHPDKITDTNVFKAYNELRLQSIWDRLTDKAIEPPEVDKVSAYDKRATEEYIMKMLVEFEQMLDENPGIKAQKSAYVVKESQYQEVVDKVMEEIRGIREHEVARQASKDEKRRVVVRDLKGYKGPKEGYPLDVEHVLMDALQNVTKKGEDQKPRSYSDISRFVNLKDLEGHLKEQDRTYVEIVTYDPLTDKHNTDITTGRGADAKREKAFADFERNLLIENLKRAESRLDELLKRYLELHKSGEGSMDEEQEVEYRELRSRLSGYHNGLRNRLERLKGNLAQLEERKNKELEPLQAAMKDVRAYIAQVGIVLDPKVARTQVIERLRATSDKYAGEMLAAKQALLKTYQELFSKKDWDSFAIREVSRESTNLIKMIYVVTPEEDILVEEERSRGGADSGRAAHSELAQGRNIYAAGELAFERRDGVWKLTEINSGSGHYRPSQDVLAYAKTVICEQLGIDPNDQDLKVRNCIFRGMDVDGLPLDYR